MKKLTPETFTEYKFVSDPTISPCGRYTAFVVQQADLDNNGYKGDLYLLENGSHAVRRLTALGDAKSFSWTKEGTLLFPALRGDKRKKQAEKGEEITVYQEIDPCGGEAQEAFCLPVKANKLVCMDADHYLVQALFDNHRPDFSQLEGAQRDQALADYKNQGYSVFEELPFWSNGRGIVNRKRLRLYVYTRSTGELCPITEPLFDTYGVSFGQGHVVYTGASYDDVRPVKPGLYVYSLANGETRELVAPGQMAIGAAEWMQGQVIAAASDGAVYGATQNPDFYLFDPISGQGRVLARFDGGIGASSVGCDSRLGGGRKIKVVGDRCYFITTEIDHSYLHFIDLSGQISPALTQKGSTDGFDIHGDTVVLLAMRGLKMEELYQLQDGKETQLTHFNDFVAEQYSLSQPEAVVYTGSDGVEIHGWVLKPIGYTPGQKYPAILHIHGGPRTVFSDTFHNEMQLWANEGYFVFYSNPRGGDGRGNAFADIWGKYGSVDYVNLMEFTDECLRRYPDADPDNLGVTGGSYGGFMTNWIIGHTDRFKAACAQRSIANWTAFEGTTDIGYHFNPAQHRTTTHQNVQQLWDQSPLKYADRVKTPTLFIHSDQDYRCWMVEGLSMFTALKYFGVEARLCLLKGENHELSRGGRPYARIKRMEEICAWMNGHLK